MNQARLWLFRAVGLSVFLSLPGCFPVAAQTLLGPGTTVTGRCFSHENEPGCVLPNLFGSGGLTLVPNPQFSHYAHYAGAAQDTLNQTLSTAIATQLAVLPLISPSSGFTYKYDSSAGAFVRTTTSFGPIYTERAETIGRAKFAFGVSYQRFRFSSLDGIDLHKIPAVFAHIPNTGPGDIPEPYEADVISSVNSVSLNLDQTVLYATIGLTDRIDFSIAIPEVSVRMGAVSNATIVRVSGPTFIPTGATGPVIPNPHQFDSNGALNHVFTSDGNASGLGDMTFRIKGSIFQRGALRVAGAFDLRTPTGDSRKFLGTGAVGIKPFVIVSLARRFSPHLNMGYQWNGDSILAGNITGTTFGEDSSDNVTIQNGPAIKKGLPGQFFYSLGADYGITPKLTFVADYLGQVLIDAPRVIQGSTVTQNVPGGTGALTLPTISGGKSTFTLNNGAVGLKYNLFGGLLITGDILFRMDDHGLRQNITPLVALSYAFGK